MITAILLLFVTPAALLSTVYLAYVIEQRLLNNRKEY